MYLNEFAQTLAPLDMTGSAEFASLLQSAADLGIPHSPDVAYRSCQTVVRGGRFHYLEWGDPERPTVVLLHGGNQSAHSWDLVSLHLADRFHVLAPDQRGHGDSEWSRESDYSLEARAADARAFIEEQKVGRPIVIGHSMGGMVTMRMVTSWPGTARAVVLVDVGPELSPTGVRTVQDFVVHNIEFDDLDEFIERVAAYDRYRSRQHIARTLKYNLLQRADGKYVSKADHRRIAVPQTTSLTLADAGAIDVPVLVIRGGESDVLDADAAERFVAALPEGRLVTVPDVGHNVHGGNTPGFLDALGPFLDALAVPS